MAAANTVLETAGIRELLDVYSRRALYTALGPSRWLEFASREEDLLKTKGDTIKINRVADIDGSADLVENVAMTAAGITSTQAEIVVSERGRALTVTEKLAQLSYLDFLDEGSKILGRHYQRFGPELLVKQTAQLGAATTFFAGGSANRAALSASDVFDSETVRDAVEALETENVPKIEMDNGEEFYVCICHPRQLRYLRQDANWIAAHNAHRTRKIFAGEAGEFEGVVFISDTNVLNGAAAATGRTSTAYIRESTISATNFLSSAAAGSSVDVYMATVFGASAFAFATALPVEMRQGGVVDYGREHGLAWYAIYGAGVLNDLHIVNIESA